MAPAFRYAALGALACLLIPRAGMAQDTSIPTDAELAKLHAEVGSTLDRRYYDAGRRIDMAQFDLEEKARQAHRPAFLFDWIGSGADFSLRMGWQKLEERRAKIADRIAALPPEGDHVLAIEDLEADRGDAGWVGIRSARVTWASGASVDLPIARFKNAAVEKDYSYHVTPVSDAIFAYGKPNRRNILLAGFSVPAGASGAATVTLSGLDDDKPGITGIRLLVDGQQIFSGGNPFKDDAWTDASFPIRAGDLEGAPPRAAEARAVKADLVKLRSDVEDFGRRAQQSADWVDRRTQAERKGLVWKPEHYGRDWWKTHFMRGICYVPFEQEITHHVRSFRHLGANFLYSYVGLYNPQSQLIPTLKAVKETGVPYSQYPQNLNRIKPNPLKLGDPQGFLQWVRAFRREAMGNSGVNIAISIDEPTFRDDVAADPNVLRDFHRYLAGRQKVLKAAGISIPADAAPVLKPTSDADRPLWMEWQLFKRQEMADHFRTLWNGLQKDGTFPFVIIMDLLSYYPQWSSHVTTGQAMPMISTDLYDNGTVREAFVMDLQRHAGRGHSILTAGAGYSDKNPSRFRRSLAVGMTHAEGVLEWTDIYCTKYRDPRAFWASGVDDQGRDILSDWDPRYWPIMENMYAQMARADRYLTGVTSTATAAVLFSERTAIADSATDGNPYTNDVMGVYSDLLRRGKPLDACFVESLDAAKLKRYRTLVLPDARVLSPAEVAMLRAWVRRGGTLIASLDTSLYDEWSRKRADFALTDVFGAHAGADGVTPASARTLEKGVLANAYGKGRCYLFTERGIGARLTPPGADQGMFGWGDPKVRKPLERLVDASAGTSPIKLWNAPDGMEMQVLRKGDAYVVHLVDWVDGRTVRGMKLSVNLPGRWRASYPATYGKPEAVKGLIAMRPVTVHEMLVLEPAR